jgi:hypothetical protein
MRILITAEINECPLYTRLCPKGITCKWVIYSHKTPVQHVLLSSFHGRKLRLRITSLTERQLVLEHRVQNQSLWSSPIFSMSFVYSGNEVCIQV